MLGASCRRKMLSHGLGSELRGMLKSGSVEGSSSLMAHQPSGDVGSISCSKEFTSRSQGLPCARPLRQHIGGLLHKSPGGLWSRPLCKRACQILQWSQGKLLSLRVAYIPGLHNIGADILSRQGLRPGNGGSIRRGGVADMEQVLPHGRGFVCMHFPQLLCSWESWREFTGTGFYYFSLHFGGRAEYGSQI